MPGANEAYDRFGSTTQLADTNRDGYADLAVGAPMENTSNGAVWSLRGSADVVTTTHAVSFSAATRVCRATRTSTSAGRCRPARTDPDTCPGSQPGRTTSKGPTANGGALRRRAR